MSPQNNPPSEKDSGAEASVHSKINPSSKKVDDAKTDSSKPQIPNDGFQSNPFQD